MSEFMRHFEHNGVGVRCPQLRITHYALRIFMPSIPEGRTA